MMSRDHRSDLWVPFGWPWALAGGSAPVFVDLQPTKDWTSPVLGSQVNVTRGWAYAIPSNIRADTNLAGASKWVPPVPLNDAVGKWLTAVVDVAAYGAGGNTNFTTRIFGTGALTDRTNGWVFHTGLLLFSPPAAGNAGGAIDMGNGVYRTWLHINPTNLPDLSITRMMMDTPSLGQVTSQFSRPCLFIGQLTPSQIEALPPSLEKASP